jgi:hypothetical protein
MDGCTTTAEAVVMTIVVRHEKTWAAMDGITTAEAVVMTIVVRHKKTWVMMVPERNNVSLVHDDGFYHPSVLYQRFVQILRMEYIIEHNVWIRGNVRGIAL